MRKITEKEIELLKKVTSFHATSGNENEVARYLNGEYQKMGFEVIKDNLGSIFAYKKSKNPKAKKVMIVAHMDEVGFIVNQILSNGSVKVQPLGGINSETLLASRVVLKTRDEKYFKGTIQSIPPHLLSPELMNCKTPIKNMIFDFGFTSKEEALTSGLMIGDRIIVDGNFETLNNNKRLLGKAFDDRLGIAAGLEILEAFKDVELDYDLFVGGSVQEEVGCRGALTASYLIKPDLAIVVDCSPARDSDGNTTELGQLGKGVLIRVVDGNFIAFRNLIDFQVKTLEKAKVPYQYFTSPGGTDAGNIHKNMDGIRTLTFCLCARNIHTNSSLLDSDDYVSLIEGLSYLLAHLTSNDIIKLGE